MVTKRKAPATHTSKQLGAKKATKRKGKTVNPAATSEIPEPVREFLEKTSIPERYINPNPIVLSELQNCVTETNLRPTVSLERLLASANRIKPADLPVEKLPKDVEESIAALKQG